jgi:hypothetical protein
MPTLSPLSATLSAGQQFQDAQVQHVRARRAAGRFGATVGFDGRSASTFPITVILFQLRVVTERQRQY